MYALWMVAYETVTDEALADKATIDTVCMWCSGPLLVTTRFDLFFAQENSFTMYLLKGNVCWWQVIVVDSVLIKSIHWRVSTWASLIKCLLGHHSLAHLILSVLSIRSIICTYLEIRRYTCSLLSIKFITERVAFSSTVRYRARICLLVKTSIEF